MENIREWFGYKNQYKAKSEADEVLNSFFDLYIEALSNYFGISRPSNVESFFKRVLAKELKKEDFVFIEWFAKKALINLNKIMSINLPNDNEFIAYLEYEKYMLEAEMDCEYPDDLRSCLIDIANDLPDRVFDSIRAYQYTVNYSQKKEKSYDSTNLERVYDNVGSYFFEGGD